MDTPIALQLLSWQTVPAKTLCAVKILVGCTCTDPERTKGDTATEVRRVNGFPAHFVLKDAPPAPQLRSFPAHRLKTGKYFFFDIG